jgi:hypothetical protein
MRKRKPTWTPAPPDATKVTRLPPNGPKPGQSTERWLYGRQQGHQRLMDDPRTKFRDLP